MRKLNPGLLKALIMLAALLWLGTGCGNSSNDFVATTAEGNTAQLRQVEFFRLNADEELAVAQDLIIFAERDITIDGNLLLNPGVSLFLVSGGKLSVSGQIVPAPQQVALESSRVLARKQAGWLAWFLGAEAALAQGTGPSRAIVMVGSSVDVSGTVWGLAGQDVHLAVSQVNGAIDINGTVRGGTGRRGTTASRTGTGGGEVHIGDSSARTAVTLNQSIVAGLFPDATPSAVEPRSPATLTIRGTVKGGTGGKGFTDTVGTDEDPAQQASLAFEGGGGGPGGDVGVQAATYDFRLPAFTRSSTAPLQGGRGGEGGDCGPARGQDGTQQGQDGESASSQTGAGGEGGDVSISDTLQFDDTQAGRAARASSFGQGGDCGNSFVAGGNGAAGGNGGDLTVSLGNLGQDGVTNPGSILSFRPEPVTVEISLLNGGNGGAGVSGTDPAGDGENGGDVDIQFSATLGFGQISLVADNYGNGGKGADGCPEIGGQGGQGGTLKFSPAPALASPTQANLPRMSIMNSFNGGQGGEGEGLMGPLGSAVLSTTGPDLDVGGLPLGTGVMPDIQNSFEFGLEGAPCDKGSGSSVDLEPSVPSIQELWPFDFSSGSCPSLPDIRVTPSGAATGSVSWSIVPLSTWGDSAAVEFTPSSGTFPAGGPIDIPVGLNCPIPSFEESFQLFLEYNNGATIVGEVLEFTYQGTRTDPPVVNEDVWLEVRNQSAVNQEFILASNELPLHEETVLFLPVGESLLLPFNEPLVDVQLFINLKPPGLQPDRDLRAGAPLSPGLGETAVFEFGGSGSAGEVETFLRSNIEF